jgi:hypothetical protein
VAAAALRVFLDLKRALKHYRAPRREAHNENGRLRGIGCRSLTGAPFRAEGWRTCANFW